MIAKMASPLGSPTLAATTAQLRNRLPTQLRRCLPLYIAGVVLGLFLLNLSAIRSARTHPATASTEIAGFSKEPAILPSERGFPKKIWQTWKVHPFAFEERDLKTAKSWPEMNPEYRYEVLTDKNEMEFIELHYGRSGFNRPDIIDFYRNVKATIVRADLLRYLIMYAEGGVYADIDVESIRPISKAVPDRYDAKDLDMVVGIEIDEPDWKDHPILGPKSRSFCQWTFICKPQLPVMMRLIEQVMTWLNDVAAGQNTTISDVELSFDQIITGTGPSAFTKAIMKEMNAKNTGDKQITWDDFHYLTESKAVSGVLVLTVEAFAAGQGHSHSANHDSRAALIKHHYHASNWPSRHPRYRHPAYGTVEDCNWEDECVRKWDRDVEAFNHLTYAEQEKIVGDRERLRLKEGRHQEELRRKEARKRREAEERKSVDEAQRTVEAARRAADEARRKGEEEVAAGERAKAAGEGGGAKQNEGEKSKKP